MYRFEPFELDESRFELRCDGGVVPLQRRPFDVLLYLVERSGRVVGKDELLASVWSDTHVTDASLARAIMMVRTALGDESDTPEFIETLRGRGYRFLRRVERLFVGDGPPSSSRRPFVGRAAQLSRMRAELVAARGGRGSILLVTGEAGIGKTRLLEELARPSSDARVHTALARCASSGAPSLWPIRQWLEALHAQRLPVDPALRRWASAESSLPALEASGGAGGGGDRSGGDGGSHGHDALERVLHQLVALSGHEPLLLVMDDLHLADPETLRFLELLAPRVRTARVVLACGSRPAAEHRGIRRCLGALAREPATRTFALEPLSRSEVETYLVSALGSLPEASIFDRLFQKTGGNPLLLGQVVQSLRIQGRPADSKVSTTALVGGDVMREAIVHHIAALPETISQLLTAASVFGTAFSLGPVARALATSTAEALEALDHAEAARIVSRERPGTYRFTYPLVRDTLYLRLSGSERVRLHAAAAAALEEEAESDGRLAADIARHLVEAAPLTEAERLARWCIRAAEHAEHVHEEPPAVLERALDALSLARGPVGESRAKLLAFCRQRA